MSRLLVFKSIGVHRRFLEKRYFNFKFNFKYTNSDILIKIEFQINKRFLPSSKPFPLAFARFISYFTRPKYCAIYFSLYFRPKIPRAWKQMVSSPLEPFFPQKVFSPFPSPNSVDSSTFRQLIQAWQIPFPSQKSDQNYIKPSVTCISTTANWKAV